MTMTSMKRRGVRASRLKLEAALAASDLPKKNQATLAEAIADAEDLEAVPKDLVSKLFRELPVDPHTIERAARVLGVEAATLYRTEQDTAFPHAQREAPASSGTAPKWRSKPRWIAALSILLVSIVGGGFFLMAAPGTSARCADGLAGSGLEMPANRLGLIVARFENDPENEAQLLLARAFAADPRFRDRLEVFTSCRRLALPPSGSYRAGVERERALAARDLKATGAQILLWGERHGDRLNVRFASRRDGETPVRMMLDNKPLVANEIDFTVPVRMGADRPIPSTVKFAALNMMQINTPTRATLRKTTTQAFHSSIEWLRDAVESDRNFLESISPKSAPRLYAITGNQLCYRLRLLGDYDGNDDHYARAEKICGDALKMTSRTHSPQEWVALHLNLASVIARRHLYAKGRDQQIAALRRSLVELEKARPAIDRKASPDNYSIYYRDAGAVHLGLGELLGGDEGIAELNRALDLTKIDLVSLDRAERPAGYAISLENMCHIKELLGERTAVIGLIKEAQNDCREVTEIISPFDQPYAWGMAQNMFAVSYAVAAEQQQDPGTLRHALREFDRAQKVYTKRDYPVDWAGGRKQSRRIHMQTCGADARPVAASRCTADDLTNSTEYKSWLR